MSADDMVAATGAGPITVEVFAREGVLAVTRGTGVMGDAWVVSHVPSGERLFRGGWTNPGEAEEAMRALVSCGNWDRPVHELRADTELARACRDVAWKHYPDVYDETPMPARGDA